MIWLRVFLPHGTLFLSKSNTKNHWRELEHGETEAKLHFGMTQWMCLPFTQFLQYDVKEPLQTLCCSCPVQTTIDFSPWQISEDLLNYSWTYSSLNIPIYLHGSPILPFSHRCSVGVNTTKTRMYFISCTDLFSDQAECQYLLLVSSCNLLLSLLWSLCLSGVDTAQGSK